MYFVSVIYTLLGISISVNLFFKKKRPVLTIWWHPPITTRNNFSVLYVMAWYNDDDGLLSSRHRLLLHSSSKQRGWCIIWCNRYSQFDGKLLPQRLAREISNLWILVMTGKNVDEVVVTFVGSAEVIGSSCVIKASLLLQATLAIVGTKHYSGY